MQQIHCEDCGQSAPSYDFVSYGSETNGYKQLCSHCFNAEVAKLHGLDDFENFRFEPVGLTDANGATHEFHFQTRLLGPIVTLEAFELRDGSPSGYEFQIVGEPDDDLLALLGKLIEKMRRALSVKHVEDTPHGLQIIDLLVRGRIDSDGSSADRMPLLVVDGREITWDEFGRMLMTFEGWQFKLEILDRSDEL